MAVDSGSRVNGARRARPPTCRASWQLLLYDTDRQTLRQTTDSINVEHIRTAASRRLHGISLSGHNSSTSVSSVSVQKIAAVKRNCR